MATNNANWFPSKAIMVCCKYMYACHACHVCTYICVLCADVSMLRAPTRTVTHAHSASPLRPHATRKKKPANCVSCNSVASMPNKVLLHWTVLRTMTTCSPCLNPQSVSSNSPLPLSSRSEEGDITPMIRLASKAPAVFPHGCSSQPAGGAGIWAGESLAGMPAQNKELLR